MSKPFIFIFLIVIILAACEKATIEPWNPDVPDNLNYTDHIQPIWDAGCIGCHGGGRAPDLRAGSCEKLNQGGYINFDNPEESNLVKRMNGIDHPYTSSPKDISYVTAWISDGAQCE